MPNPVVSFEIRGPNSTILRAFYAEVFGWELFPFSETYAGIETTSHSHDEATGSTTYTGTDRYMNDGVQIGSSGGQPAWKFSGESYWRAFEPGIAGGISLGEGPAVSIYIQVKDLAVALSDVERHGGKTVQPPAEVAPNVNVASFSDPAGNVIGLVLAR